MDPITAIFGTIGKVLDLFPNSAQKAEVLKQVNDAQLEIAKGQLEVNKIEAASTNWFVAGWRPATGWVCLAGLVYHTVAPAFGLTVGGVEVLVSLLVGMLGLGTLRTIEKTRK